MPANFTSRDEWTSAGAIALCCKHLYCAVLKMKYWSINQNLLLTAFIGK